MRLSEAFPSKYLKVDDLDNRRVIVTVRAVEMETVGDESKLVVYFTKGSKGMVLNRTNAQTIAAIAGSEDTDDWPGTSMRLYATPVLFQGKMVPSIRIEAAPQEAESQRPKPMARVVADDETVPF